ncbi:hypothetical protein TRFO_22754 [Tritrichomonas foetus]|uniref:Uncharacterized protein n=1 Tax=Tritrichomonas foetus TaxID=1144522 RepID=A0A1J4KFW0_9EUKA|nr:hypothetical protein TRFO_22754 [Tritrichomonas foetus]|eukprot:OHT08668.1 hypothetical protein TRFO_22754 [Tritrichomonas foetus]
MSEIDFDIIGNPSHSDFINQIQDAPELVGIENVSRFFDVALSNFTKKRTVTHKRGKAILIAVITILQNNTYRSIFIDNGNLLSLPYGIEEYADLIFDLLHIFVTQDSYVFDSVLAEKLALQIPFSPSKSLILIAKYGEKFSSLEHPWDILDLLFYHSSKFVGKETAIDYIKLLTYLCRRKERYNEYRSMQCFDTIAIAFLKSKDVEILKAAYCSLISISNKSDKCRSKECLDRFPINSVLSHLQSSNEDLVSHALQFLLSYELTNDKILAQLIKLNTTSATLALMKLCENQKNALYMANNDSWLKYALPTTLESLKLIYCLLNHKQIQKKFISSQNFLNFLVLSSNNASKEILVLILGILKQLPLTSQKITELEKKKFFSNIVQSADNCNCELSDQARYNIFEIVAQYQYTKELIGVCECAVTEILEMESLSSEAFRLVLLLCRYPECVRVMRKDGLVDFYTKHMKNSKMKKRAQIFLETIPDDYGDDDDYNEEDYENAGYTYSD